MTTKSRNKKREFRNFLNKLPPGWEPREYLIHVLMRHRYVLDKAAKDLGYTGRGNVSLLCAAYGVQTGQDKYYESTIPAIAELLKQGKSLAYIAGVIGMEPRALSTMLRKKDIWADSTPVVFCGCPPREITMRQMLAVTGMPMGTLRFKVRATGVPAERFLYEELCKRGMNVCILYPAGYSASLVTQLLLGETS